MRPTLVIGALALTITACGTESTHDPTVGNVRSSSDATSVSGAADPGASGQNRTAGSFTVEFARCMRAHDVPAFPDPNGRSGQLGPDSGIDMSSAVVLAALNGPCRSLAPPAWVSDDGPGSVDGGGA